MSLRILLTADPILPVPPSKYGGIERIVDALVGAFRSAGHQVGLVAKSGSTATADAVFAWPASSVRGGPATLRNAFALARFVRKFRPDVIHSFSRLIYLQPLFATDRRTPKIMSYQRHTGPARLRWARRLAGEALSFTGCSEFICAMGRPAGGNWTCVPNFVDPAKITFSPHVPPAGDLLFLSRVESIKGPDLAIAIARRSGRRLIIAGNRAEAGSERDYWNRQIAPHLGRDGIEYVGEVDDQQKNDLLGRAAALVVPVQWDEPFGIVFAEALAAGTPVITCARGALPEIIRDGETGYFVRSVEEGVTAVNRLDEIQRARCRRDAETRFSVAVCASRYLQLYGSLRHAARNG